MEVRLHQEVGALGQRHRDALRKEGGRGAGHPSAESAIERAERIADREDGAEAGESGLAVHAILLARAAGGIGEEQRVMHHASRAEGFSSMARTHLSSVSLVGMTKLR